MAKRSFIRVNVAAVRQGVAKGWSHAQHHEIPMLLLNVPYLLPSVQKDPTAPPAQSLREQMRHWRWGRVVLAMVVVGLALAVSLNWLWLGYEWVWSHTTWTPWTCIMRAHPWLLPLFTIPAYAGMVGGMWIRMGYEFRVAVENTDARLRPFVTELVIVTLAISMGIGIIFGHVYWGGHC